MATNISQAEALNFKDGVDKKAYAKEAKYVDTYVKPESAEGRLKRSSKLQTARAIEALASIGSDIAKGLAQDTKQRAQTVREQLEETTARALNDYKNGIDYTKENYYTEIGTSMQIKLQSAIGTKQALDVHNRMINEFSNPEHGATWWLDPKGVSEYKEKFISKYLAENDHVSAEALYQNIARENGLAQYDSAFNALVAKKKHAHVIGEIEKAYKTELSSAVTTIVSLDKLEGGAVSSEDKTYYDYISNNEVVPEDLNKKLAENILNALSDVEEKFNIDANIFTEKTINKDGEEVLKQRQYLSNTDMKKIATAFLIDYAKTTNNPELLNVNNYPTKQITKADGTTVTVPIYGDELSNVAFLQAEFDYFKSKRIEENAAKTASYYRDSQLKSDAQKSAVSNYLYIDGEKTDTALDWSIANEALKAKGESDDETLNDIYRQLQDNPFLMQQLEIRTQAQTVDPRVSDNLRLDLDFALRLSNINNLETLHKFVPDGNGGFVKGEEVLFEGEPVLMNAQALEDFFINNEGLNTNHVNEITSNIEKYAKFLNVDEYLTAMTSKMNDLVSKNQTFQMYQKIKTTEFLNLKTEIETKAREDMVSHIKQRTEDGLQPNYETLNKIQQVRFDEFNQRLIDIVGNNNEGVTSEGVTPESVTPLEGGGDASSSTSITIDDASLEQAQNTIYNMPTTNQQEIDAKRIAQERLNRIIQEREKRANQNIYERYADIQGNTPKDVKDRKELIQSLIDAGEPVDWNQLADLTGSTANELKVNFRMPTLEEVKVDDNLLRGLYNLLNYRDNQVGSFFAKEDPLHKKRLNLSVKDLKKFEPEKLKEIFGRQIMDLYREKYTEEALDQSQVEFLKDIIPFVDTDMEARDREQKNIEKDIVDNYLSGEEMVAYKINDTIPERFKRRNQFTNIEELYIPEK